MAAAPRIGVLAYQGDVREHLAALAEVGADPVEVRTLADLETVDGLVVPGGESTVIGKLAARYGRRLSPQALRAVIVPRSISMSVTVVSIRMSSPSSM
jgi:glutamine amidotransferase PdxT